MTAVQTAPRATVPTVPRAALTRLAGMRRTSVGRLRLLLVVLLVLTTLTGAGAGLAARSAVAGTTDLRERAQPLLSEAEIVYSSLADADTTAAQAFITGGLEPPGLTRRYDEKLAAAAAALTSAARRVPADGKAADAIRSIATGIGDYTALVATARALNRQGKPVGASYLSTASQLSRDTLQPQAQALFVQAQREAAAGYQDARSDWWVLLLIVLLAILGTALLATQIHLSRTTRRTFNVPLVTASALTVLLALICGTIFTHQRAQQDPYAKVVGPKFTEEPYAIAIAKTHPEFTRFVNGVLERMRADGTWSSIHERWLGASGPALTPPEARYR